MFLHPPRSLAGLAVWAHRTLLAFDQWGKLLESGQLWQIAQKEKSMPLQKFWFFVTVFCTSTHPHFKKKKKRRRKMQGEMRKCFFYFPLKIRVFCAEGEKARLWVEEQEEEVGRGKAALRHPQQMNLLSDVGSWHGSCAKAAARPTANDGCYNLTKVWWLWVCWWTRSHGIRSSLWGRVHNESAVPPIGVENALLFSTQTSECCW